MSNPFRTSRSSTAAKVDTTIEARIKINPNPTAPGASSLSATEIKKGMPATYKALIMIAQYFIFLNALTDNSEKAMFLSFLLPLNISSGRKPERPTRPDFPCKFGVFL